MPLSWVKQSALCTNFTHDCVCYKWCRDVWVVLLRRHIITASPIVYLKSWWALADLSAAGRAVETWKFSLWNNIRLLHTVELFFRRQICPFLGIEILIIFCLSSGLLKVHSSFSRSVPQQCFVFKNLVAMQLIKKIKFSLWKILRSLYIYEPFFHLHVCALLKIKLKICLHFLLGNWKLT